ncbi:unnamed protein product, partial [Rangifer tarandus platyrhynchus]
MPGLLGVWKPQTFREKLISVFGHKDSLQKANLTLLHPLHPDRSKPLLPADVGGTSASTVRAQGVSGPASEGSLGKLEAELSSQPKRAR